VLNIVRTKRKKSPRKIFLKKSVAELAKVILSVGIARLLYRLCQDDSMGDSGIDFFQGDSGSKCCGTQA
jgi:hypothetical protein